MYSFCSWGKVGVGMGWGLTRYVGAATSNGPIELPSVTGEGILSTCKQQQKTQGLRQKPESVTLVHRKSQRDGLGIKL